MRVLALVLSLCPVGALAWERLDGPAIAAALNDRTLIYDEYTLQHFHKSGATDYVTERFSSGRWAVREGRYCSVWPPSDTWACYDVEAEGNALRFISDDGFISEGTYRE